jgi:hypothetical protein
MNTTDITKLSAEQLLEMLKATKASIESYLRGMEDLSSELAKRASSTTSTEPHIVDFKSKPSGEELFTGFSTEDNNQK